MGDEPRDRLALVRGSLRVPRELYDLWFAGVDACVLLRDGDDLLVLPVRHLPGGGHLLKVRNARGDRVVAATDFFRDHGAEADRSFDVAWSTAAAGLVAARFFAMD